MHDIYIMKYINIKNYFYLIKNIRNYFYLINNNLIEF